MVHGCVGDTIYLSLVLLWSTWQPRVLRAWILARHASVSLEISPMQLMRPYDLPGLRCLSVLAGDLTDLAPIMVGNWPP